MSALNATRDQRVGLAPSRSISELGSAWPTLCFLVIACAAAAFAFVGLSRSSYWIDELFTLSVADHHGGAAEVLRRALTDTHPPAYYLLVNFWISLFGDSEAAVRTLSATAAVATLIVLFVGLRGAFSVPARLFAVATAATSQAFFEHAQNARSYALCFLLGAMLISAAYALDRRARRGEPVSAGLFLLMWLISLVASFTHFYLFLATGGVYLFLLVRARTAGERVLTALCGLAVAALVAAYTVVLLHSTALDVRHTWFSNDSGTLAEQTVWALKTMFSGAAAVAVALLAFVTLRRGLRPAATPAREGRGGGNGLLGLAVTTVLVTLGAGLMVSFLVAPSFGARNLVVLAPFLWITAAWLYDAAALDPRRPWGKVLIAALVLATALNASLLRGRFLPRQEEWRASANFVNADPRCAGKPLAVVLPYRFGPPTAFYRHLAERYFFGRYDRQPWRLQAYTPAEFAGAARTELGTQLRQTAMTGCPILAWGVHDLTSKDAERLRRNLALAVGAPDQDVRVRVFQHDQLSLRGVKTLNGAYVFLLQR